MLVTGIAGNSNGPDLYFEELDSPETNNGLSTGLDWEKLYGFYSEISKNNPSQKTSLFLNSTMQKSLDLETDHELTNSPRFVLKAGLTQLIADFFTIAPEAHYESKRITVYDTTTNPFFLANLNITSKTLFNHLRLNFKIKNIFDLEYAYPGG